MLRKQRVNKVFSIMLALCLIAGSVPAAVFADETGSGSAELLASAEWSGSGTQEDPYLIKTEADFVKLCANLDNNGGYENNYFVQTRPLSMNRISFGEGGTFKGTYDGAGNAIELVGKGLFRVGPTGIIKNLGLTGRISGADGGAVTGNDVAPFFQMNGKVINCYSLVTVTGGMVGGFSLGGNNTYVNCYFAGSLTGVDPYIGAIAGTNSVPLNLTRFYYPSEYRLTADTQTAAGATAMSKDSMKGADFAAALNSGREDAANALGCDVDEIVEWTASGSNNPTLKRDLSTNLKGEGTLDSPILIETEEDFAGFVLQANTLDGKYVKQTQDLDMSNLAGFNGSSASFNGVYDGAGHTLNINFLKAYIFRVDTEGIVKNLGITGAIHGQLNTSNIGPFNTMNGKMVNCYSLVSVLGGMVGGFAYDSTQATAAYTNCYFAGTLTGYDKYTGAISGTSSGPQLNKFYAVDEYKMNADSDTLPGSEKMARADMQKEAFVQKLNEGRADAEEALKGTAGEGKIRYWTMGSDGYPRLTEAIGESGFTAYTSGGILTNLANTSGYGANNSLIVTKDKLLYEGEKLIYDAGEEKTYDLYYSPLLDGYIGWVPAANVSAAQAASNVKITKLGAGESTEIQYGILADDRSHTEMSFKDLYFFDSTALLKNQAASDSAEHALAMDVNADFKLDALDLVALINKYVNDVSFSASGSN